MNFKVIACANTLQLAKKLKHAMRKCLFGKFILHIEHKLTQQAFRPRARVCLWGYAVYLLTDFSLFKKDGVKWRIIRVSGFRMEFCLFLSEKYENCHRVEIDFSKLFLIILVLVTILLLKHMLLTRSLTAARMNGFPNLWVLGYSVQFRSIRVPDYTGYIFQVSHADINEIFCRR